MKLEMSGLECKVEGPFSSFCLHEGAFSISVSALQCVCEIHVVEQSIHILVAEMCQRLTRVELPRFHN